MEDVETTLIWITRMWGRNGRYRVVEKDDVWRQDVQKVDVGARGCGERRHGATGCGATGCGAIPGRIT